jgi:hypothetical protein
MAGKFEELFRVAGVEMDAAFEAMRAHEHVPPKPNDVTVWRPGDLVPGVSDTHYSPSATIVRKEVGGREATMFTLPAIATRMPSPPAGPGGFRAEALRIPHEFGLGKLTEVSYRMGVYFPHDFAQGRNATSWQQTIIWQFNDNGSPHLCWMVDWARVTPSDIVPLVLRLEDGPGNFKDIARTTALASHWYDLGLEIRWSQEGDGFIRAFCDSDRIMPAPYDGPTLSEWNTTYMKCGAYGQPGKLAIDDVRWAPGADRYMELRAEEGV